MIEATRGIGGKVGGSDGIGNRDGASEVVHRADSFEVDGRAYGLFCLFEGDDDAGLEAWPGGPAC